MITYFDTLKTRKTDQSVALFSIHSTDTKAGKGISLEDAEKAVVQFEQEFGDKHGLSIVVVTDTEQFFNTREAREAAKNAKDAYYATSKTIVLFPANLGNVQDAFETLRHEILDHYDLNLFEPNVKKQALEQLIRSRNKHFIMM